jgi:hypothetical protein
MRGEMPPWDRLGRVGTLALAVSAVQQRCRCAAGVQDGCDGSDATLVTFEVQASSELVDSKDPERELKVSRAPSTGVPHG